MVIFARYVASIDTLAWCEEEHGLMLKNLLRCVAGFHCRKRPLWIVEYYWCKCQICKF